MGGRVGARAGADSANSEKTLKGLSQEKVEGIVPAFGVTVHQIDRPQRRVDAEKTAAGENQIVKAHVAAVVPYIPRLHGRPHIDRELEQPVSPENVADIFSKENPPIENVRPYVGDFTVGNFLFLSSHHGPNINLIASWPR